MNDYLQHHGILGMKWGVRRFQNKNGSLTSAGKKRYAEKSRKRALKLTDRQKRAIKIGAAVAISGLAVYGGYKLYKSGVNYRSLSEPAGFSGENKFGSKVESINENLIITDKVKRLSEETGLPLKTQSTGSAKDCIQSNPDYDHNKEEYQNNCSHAVIAFLLRRQGLDVQAKPMKFDESGGLSFNEIGRYFKDLTPTPRFGLKESSTGEAYRDRLANHINNTYTDSNCSGIIRLGRIGGGGHYVAWEKTEGKVSILDPQTGNPTALNYFNRMLKGGDYNRKDITMARIDNLDFRKADRLKEVVEKRRE